MRFSARGRDTVVVLSFALLVAAAAAAQEPSPSPSPEAPPIEGSPAPPPSPLPVYATAAPSGKVFNPDISAIGDFLGAVGKNDTAFATPTLELHEAEVGLQAIVDPYAKADFFLTFSPDSVGVEEGYITFTSLPASLLLKVGKMRASFGKVNQMHNHVLPWTDRPLVTQDLAGGEDGISDAGLSLSRLFPNKLLFLEAIGEVYRGENNVFVAPRRQDVTLVGRLRGYRDINEATNLDFGASIAHGRASSTIVLPVDSSSTPPTAEPDPAIPLGNRRLIGTDVILRYRPLRRAVYRRFNLRNEMIWNRTRDTLGSRTLFGTYVAAEYQFAQRWFSAARWDRSDRFGAQGVVVDKGESLALTFWPSEFSQVRGQYRHTRYGEAIVADEFLFQFQFSIGAHGAHTF